MAVPSPKKTRKDLPRKKKTVIKPEPRPFSEKRKSGAVKKSLRPQKRPDVVDLTPPEEADQLLLKEKSGGKVTKMGMGGKCRGMGAASRGGAFTRNG